MRMPSGDGEEARSMRITIPGLVAAILAVIGIEKALHALTIVPIANEGLTVAANGGDFGPYIVAMLGVVIAIALPWGLLNALADIG